DDGFNLFSLVPPHADEVIDAHGEQATLFQLFHQSVFFDRRTGMTHGREASGVEHAILFATLLELFFVGEGRTRWQSYQSTRRIEQLTVEFTIRVTTDLSTRSGRC